ncbi:MAG: Tyrosine-protein kinase MasK [Lentisphaerae bacterium ADurb.BinA184]|nr:MAG: Tyrosine-protein kinase MasK [Lentisphaerae bacterium ADurb.BinA184]
MAPEQAEGHAGQLDRQTDVFLIGATLYHILTLAPPYAAEDPEAALALAAAGRLAAPESLHECADVPEELRRITLKALAARKDQRYASVTELAADIDSVLSGRVLSVRRRFAAGESLMRAGEPGQEAYVIMCGRVEVVQDSAGGTVRLGILGPGDIVGEIAIITHKERSATVTALEDTEALVITEALMQDALRKTPPWLGKTVTALARRLREIDRLVHPLLAGASPYHVLGQLSLLLPPRTPDPAGTTLDWASTAATIGLNLGVSPAHVEPVLCALADSGLASCQPDGRLLVADRARLERFVEFCRHVLTGDDLAGLPDHERAEFERIHDTLARQGAGRTPSAAS